MRAAIAEINFKIDLNKHIAALYILIRYFKFILGEQDMKDTKKEWKDPEIVVLSVNNDTEGGSGTAWDQFDNTLS